MDKRWRLLAIHSLVSLLEGEISQGKLAASIIRQASLLDITADAAQDHLPVPLVQVPLLRTFKIFPHLQLLTMVGQRFQKVVGRKGTSCWF